MFILKSSSRCNINLQLLVLWRWRGTVFPLQALGGPGRLRLPDFLDFRHYEGGRSLAICTGRLYPQELFWYLFSEAESTPGRVVPVGSFEKNPQRRHWGFFFVLSLYFVCTSLSWFSWLCLLSLLYNTYNTNSHAPGGIRTRNPSKRSAVDTRLRPLGHWDRLGIDPETIRLVAQCLNHYATPGQVNCSTFNILL